MMSREEKKRQTHAKLVESALAVFSEHGFEHATVEEITRRARVAKGTFFNYFRTKADVLLHVGAVQEAWMAGEIVRLQSSPGTRSDQIIELMVSAASRLALTRPLVRAMFQATLQSPEESDIQVAHFHRVGAALISLLEDGRAKGELSLDLTGEEMALLVMQTYSSALLTWSLSTGTESLAMHVRRTFDALFDGLRRRKD